MKTSNVFAVALMIGLIGLIGCGTHHSKMQDATDPRKDQPVTGADAGAQLPAALPDNDTGATPVPPSREPDPATIPATNDSRPVAEVVDISTPLAATSRLCADANFGKGNLEACYSGASVISRFDSVLLQFSLVRAVGKVPEQLLTKLLEKNLSVKDPSGHAVEGRLIWKDLRTLMFDPYAELKPNTTYTIAIASVANDSLRPRSNQGRILTPFSFQVQTQGAFGMTHSINGQAINQDQGLSLDQKDAPSLKLASTLDGLANVKRLTLRRLGSKQERVLCQDSCSDAALKLDLNNELAPIAGLNSYEFHIQGKLGEEIYRHFSVSWGTINTHPADAIDGGVYAALDREDGLKAVAHLVGEFAAGRFTMDYRDENGGVHPKLSFNDIIAFKKTTYKASAPTPCDKSASTDFTYLQNLGPFCALAAEGDTGILGGVLGQVHYKAAADIYVTDMQVIQEAGNVSATMSPEEKNLEMHLGVKKFKGHLHIILRIDEAKYFGAISVPGATGFFYYDTDFSLDGPMRDTIAKTDISVANGRLGLRIHGIDQMNLANPLNGSANDDTYFDTQEWTHNVAVAAVKQIDEKSGLWAKLVNMVVNQAVTSQVDTFKPQIVNGIARDILQVVAPNTLNTIVEQLKTGLQVFLPSHLPSPLDRTKIQVAGSLGNNLGLAVRNDNSYLTTPLKFTLKSLVDQPNGRPDNLNGPNGFVQTPDGVKAPSPLTAGTDFGGGSLLSLSVDVLNQTLYDVWKQGMLNLNLDNAFVNKVETFAVFDPENEANGKEILLAEFLPKLLGSDISRMEGKDSTGKTIVMDKSDKITLVIDEKLPPFLRMKRVPRADGKDDLVFALALSDVVINIQGLHNDQTYSIAKIRMSVTADSHLKFVPYQNPMRHPEFSGVGAIGVEIYKDATSLDYFVEVAEGVNANSFAIDTGKLRSTISDMVDQLFIPLLNDGLREVPLTGLRTCGVELDAGKMEILPLPRSGSTPFMLVKAPLKNYDFSGHCDLLPDLTSPLPPLPDVVVTDPPPTTDPTTGTPGTGTNSGGRVDLNMDFSLIPWQLNDHQKVPDVETECQSQIFFDASCASAWVEYVMENGKQKLDDRGRPIYDYTHIKLSTLVPKSAYNLRGPDPSIEYQFFNFAKWPEYVQGAEDNIIFKDSIPMADEENQYGTFKRHYVDFETNSPKASGFIPIRDVTLHRVLATPFDGAEVSTEFYVDTSSSVAVPDGKPALKGAEGLDYHVGNIHIIDCGKVSWCQDSTQWLVIYDSKIRPQDKSIPEDVVPYLKAGLNAIIAGMFPL